MGNYNIRSELIFSCKQTYPDYPNFEDVVLQIYKYNNYYSSLKALQRGSDSQPWAYKIKFNFSATSYNGLDEKTHYASFADMKKELEKQVTDNFTKKISDILKDKELECKREGETTGDNDAENLIKYVETLHEDGNPGQQGERERQSEWERLEDLRRWKRQNIIDLATQYMANDYDTFLVDFDRLCSQRRFSAQTCQTVRKLFACEHSIREVTQAYARSHFEDNYPTDVKVEDAEIELKHWNDHLQNFKHWNEVAIRRAIDPLLSWVLKQLKKVISDDGKVEIPARVHKDRMAFTLTKENAKLVNDWDEQSLRNLRDHLNSKIFKEEGTH